MENSKTIKIITALEARSDAEAAQEENFEKALERIAQAAKRGENETLLMGINLNFKGVNKLMDLGYNVSAIIHPFEQIRMHKVLW